jgi:hypothetical protein
MPDKSMDADGAKQRLSFDDSSFSTDFRRDAKKPD